MFEVHFDGVLDSAVQGMCQDPGGLQYFTCWDPVRNIYVQNILMFEIFSCPALELACPLSAWSGRLGFCTNLSQSGALSLVEIL